MRNACRAALGLPVTWCLLLLVLLSFGAPANAASLERTVYDVPKEIDDEIARLKLATMGVAIDELTEEQATYLASWDEGT